MPHLEYFVVAESATVDQITNRVSIFNVCDELHAVSFPIRIKRIVAVCSWNAEEGDKGKEFQLEVRVKPPTGEASRFNANFTIPERRHRALLTIEGIPVSGPGSVEFELLVNGKHHATHTIAVFGSKS